MPISHQPISRQRLYLASTSPARLATLRAAGIEPVVVPSHVDEDAAVEAAGPLTPMEMVLLLARLKASAVLGAEIDGFVLGGDSAFELDGIVTEESGGLLKTLDPLAALEHFDAMWDGYLQPHGMDRRLLSEDVAVE